MFLPETRAPSCVSSNDGTRTFESTPPPVKISCNIETNGALAAVCTPTLKSVNEAENTVHLRIRIGNNRALEVRN